MGERPAWPLSVVVTTTDPWPKLETFFEAIEPQLREVGGQLVACDGSGRGLPPGLADDGRYVAVVQSGASVFDLRARGAVAASGEIVAFTEDHCVPEPSWCAEVLAAHRRAPDAAVVGGAVVNGSTSTLTDWANFLMTFAEYLPPLGPAPGARVPLAANLSFKRSALPAEAPPPGWIELELLPRLCREGRVALSDAPRVGHVQSHGVLGTPVVHFHNGRSTTGLRSHRSSNGELAREVVRHAWHPFQLWRETLAAVRARPGLPLRAKLSLPAVLGLALCHSAGEVVGLLRGPGDSPRRLE